MLLEYITLYCIALRCVELHCVELHCVALRCIALHCVVLRCNALHSIPFHCIAFHCTALSGRLRPELRAAERASAARIDRAVLGDEGSAVPRAARELAFHDAVHRLSAALASGAAQPLLPLATLRSVLHYTTLHYITLRYSTLHYVRLRYIT